MTENTDLIARLRMYAAGDVASDTVTDALCIEAADALEAAQGFDAWNKNLYTKVLQKSIAEDYVPKAVQPAPQVPMTEGDLLQALLRADWPPSMLSPVIRQKLIDLTRAVEAHHKIGVKA